MDETQIIEEIKTPHEYYRFHLLFGTRYAIIKNENNLISIGLKDYKTTLTLKKDVAYPIIDLWQEKPISNFQNLLDILTENEALITNE